MLRAWLATWAIAAGAVDGGPEAPPVARAPTTGARSKRTGAVVIQRSRLARSGVRRTGAAVSWRRVRTTLGVWDGQVSCAKSGARAWRVDEPVEPGAEVGYDPVVDPVEAAAVGAVEVHLGDFKVVGGTGSGRRDRGHVGNVARAKGRAGVGGPDHDCPHPRGAALRMAGGGGSGPPLVGVSTPVDVPAVGPPLAGCPVGAGAEREGPVTGRHRRGGVRHRRGGVDQLGQQLVGLDS